MGSRDSGGVRAPARARIGALGRLFGALAILSLAAGCGGRSEVYEQHRNPVGDMRLVVEVSLEGGAAGSMSLTYWLLGGDQQIELPTIFHVANTSESWTGEYTVNICSLAGETFDRTVSLRTTHGEVKDVTITTLCNPRTPEFWFYAPLGVPAPADGSIYVSPGFVKSRPEPEDQAQ